MEQLTQLQPPKPSNFDPHHPPDAALIDDCVHCGFCLPACPTYVLWGEEMDSPRGRIYMMKKTSQGEAPLDGRFRLHMDNCLGCMACMTACPSGVQYDKLIEDTRAQVERNIPRLPADALFRKLLFATFPYANRLRLLALPMFIYQRSGLQRLHSCDRGVACCSKTYGGDGVASATGSLKIVQTFADSHQPRIHSASACWHALWLRPAGLLSARQ